MKKKEKGSISLYVLIVCTFFVTILMTLYINLVGKAQTIEEGLRKIKENYADLTEISNPDNAIIAKESEFETSYGVIDIVWIKGETEEVAQTVNRPILVSTSEESMTAVKFDENSKTWVEALNPAEDTSWYDYSDQVNQWANAKTKNGSYFVWIPRYAYRITYYESEESYKNGESPTGYYDGEGQWNAKTGKVRKVLEDGVKVVEYNEESYIIHPAFCSNASIGGSDRELTGIWVAKYEMSGNSAETLQSISGTQSFSNVTIGQCYEYSRTAKYGYKTIGYMESHLIKNSEWGAVSYLTQSKFGRNGFEVEVNTSQTTGGGSDITKTTLQSTTENVYGIYDMSGDSWEYVAAVNENIDRQNAINNGWTKFENTSTSTKFETKYKNDLGVGSGNQVIYNYGIIGDATKEVNTGGKDSKESTNVYRNWNGDNSDLMYSSEPYIKRGGSSENGELSGIFSSSYDDGIGGVKTSFRTVLCPENNAPISDEVDADESFSNNYGVIDIIWMKGNSVLDSAQVPNHPILTNNNESMEAVEFNSSSNTWTKVANSNSTTWYSYDGTTNRWANARTKNGSYFVWIPRYAYRIIYYESKESYERGESPTGYYDGYGQWSSTTRKLRYKIESGIQTKEYNGKKYIIHPAFCTSPERGGFERELEGIWVAKYEASGESSDTLAFVPGIKSQANQNAGVQYTSARNAKYGYKTAGYMDSHMMKNSEWGAVIYLSYSKFGTNKQSIEINTTPYTGGGQANSYISNKKQSTTGNVYGIYDMAGGLNERMAGHHAFSWVEGNTYSLWANAVGVNENSESNKFFTRYCADSVDPSRPGKEPATGKTGDASREIINIETGNSWFGQTYTFTTEFSPLLTRGGNYKFISAAGIMYLNKNEGYADSVTTFRTVLCP